MQRRFCGTLSRSFPTSGGSSSLVKALPTEDLWEGQNKRPPGTGMLGHFDFGGREGEESGSVEQRAVHRTAARPRWTETRIIRSITGSLLVHSKLVAVMQVVCLGELSREKHSAGFGGKCLGKASSHPSLGVTLGWGPSSEGSARPVCGQFHAMCRLVNY